MKTLHMVSFIAVIAGAINWALIGLFNYNVVAILFGTAPMIMRVVYVAIGLAAVQLLMSHQGDCKVCSASVAPAKKSLKKKRKR
jgi:uncharacterized protein